MCNLQTPRPKRNSEDKRAGRRRDGRRDPLSRRSESHGTTHSDVAPMRSRAPCAASDSERHEMAPQQPIARPAPRLELQGQLAGASLHEERDGLALGTLRQPRERP